MKNKYIILVTITFIFFSCNKIDPIPNNSSSNANYNANDEEVVYSRVDDFGVKIAEKINGKTDCSLDDDIIESAIKGFYGGGVVKNIRLGEYHKNQTDVFYVLEGKIEIGSQTIQYAFEIAPLTLGNGDIDFYLSSIGTEQNVTSTNGASGKLKLTSSTTGYMNPANSGSVYTTKDYMAWMNIGGGLVITPY